MIGSPRPHSIHSRRKRPCGFTLLELLVVIGIIGVLLGFLLPSVRRAREAAPRSQCKNQLKQIGLALHSYNETYGAFPPAYTVDASGRPLHSWRTLILPFVDEKALYEKIDLSKPWNDPANAEAYAAELAIYRCPSADLPPHQTTYMALVTAESFFQPEESRSFGESGNDGDALMVIEVPPENAIHWMRPLDADEDLMMGFGPETVFAHQGGYQGLRVDTSVWYFTGNMPAHERRELMRYDVKSGGPVSSKE